MGSEVGALDDNLLGYDDALPLGKVLDAVEGINDVLKVNDGSEVELPDGMLNGMEELGTEDGSLEDRVLGISDTVVEAIAVVVVAHMLPVVNSCILHQSIQCSSGYVSEFKVSYGQMTVVSPLPELLSRGLTPHHILLWGSVYKGKQTSPLPCPEDTDVPEPSPSRS